MSTAAVFAMDAEFGSQLLSALGESGIAGEAFLELGALRAAVLDRAPRAVMLDDAPTVNMAFVAGLLRIRPDMVVLCLIRHDHGAHLPGLLSLGSCISASRELPASDLADILMRLLEGNVLLPMSVLRAAVVGGSPSLKTLAVSEDELKLLRRLADGETVKAIAESVWLSRRQMHRRLRQLYRRLGASTRSEALTRAAKLGLLGPSGGADKPI
jgi:two-component system response regulator DesR